MTITALTAIPRHLRPVVRAAITAHPGWQEWRMANLPARCNGLPPDVSQLWTAEALQAVAALQIDVAALAAAAPAPTTAETNAAIDEEIEAMIDADLNTEAADVNPFEGKAAADVLRDVLAPADGMVGAKLFAMLHAAVSPLAAIAVQGPRTIVQTRTIMQAASVPCGDTPHVTPLHVKPARTVFGVRASDAGKFAPMLAKPVQVYSGTPGGVEGVPPVDPYHVWDAQVLAYLTLAAHYADTGHVLRHSCRVLAYGPAGTGKTTSAAQFAAQTGRPFFRVPFDRNTEAVEIIGQLVTKPGGGAEFREGGLVQAMQVPGAVILLDEPSFLRPGAAAVLQTILDTGVVFLKEDGNRRVEMAPGVMIVAADNTNLTGDATGRYADTLAQNVALQDRFAFMVPVDYMAPEVEANVLRNRTGIPLDAALMMTRFAVPTREKAAATDLSAGCSLRRLMAWATACAAGVPSTMAFKTAILNAARPDEYETLRGIEQNTVDHTAMDALVAGKPLPVAPAAPSVGTSASVGHVSTPAGGAAAGVFATAPVNP